MTAQIIHFPVERMKTAQPTITKDQEKEITRYVDEMVGDFGFQLMTAMQGSVGADITVASMSEDIKFVIEAFRATMLRYKGIKHPLQTVIDVYYDESDPDTRSILNQFFEEESNEAENLNHIGTRE